MYQKIQEEFFVSEIITSELVSLKFSVLTTRYLSSAANLLTSSPKLWHVNKRHFLQLNCLASDQ